MLDAGKKLYELNGGQTALLMAEVFTMEPWDVRYSNLIRAYFRVPENCDLHALERAFNKVIENNDALRLRIIRKGLRFYQYVEDYSPKTLEKVAIGSSESDVDAYLQSSSERKIKMLNTDLVWAQMAQCGTGGILLMVFHHFCADGFSLDLIFRALERYYDCYASGNDVPSEKSYSITNAYDQEIKYRNSTAFEQDRAYWKAALSSQPHYVFPLGRRSERGAAATRSMTISGESFEKLIALCHDNNCSLQSTVMALAAVLVYVKTGEYNFSLSALSHNRTTPASKHTVGCLMTSYLTIFNIDTNMAMDEFLRDTFMHSLKDLSHGRFPIDQLTKYIFKESIRNGFNFHHQWISFSLLDFVASTSTVKYKASMLRRLNIAEPLYVGIQLLPNEGVEIQLTYQVHKFSADCVESILSDFLCLTHLTLDDPSSSIEELKNKFLCSVYNS